MNRTIDQTHSARMQDRADDEPGAMLTRRVYRLLFRLVRRLVI
jgi:hypothetical protein